MLIRHVFLRNSLLWACSHGNVLQVLDQEEAIALDEFEKLERRLGHEEAEKKEAS